jgi:hypothetical protein
VSGPDPLLLPIALLMAASPEGFALANRFDHVQKSLGFTLLV